MLPKQEIVLPYQVIDSGSARNVHKFVSCLHDYHNEVQLRIQDFTNSGSPTPNGEGTSLLFWSFFLKLRQIEKKTRLRVGACTPRPTQPPLDPSMCWLPSLRLLLTTATVLTAPFHFFDTHPSIHKDVDSTGAVKFPEPRSSFIFREIFSLFNFSLFCSFTMFKIKVIYLLFSANTLLISRGNHIFTRH